MPQGEESVPEQPDENKQEMKEVVSIEKSKEEKEDEDEKKDTEKPLLTTEEQKESITIEELENDDSGNIPTLQLQHKKQKDVEDDIENQKPVTNKTEKPPSMFIHPFNRMEYEWKNSSGLLEFFTKAICIVTASLGWLFCVGGVPLMSVIEIIIGSMYLHDCPADPRIPEYLVVAGVLGTVQHMLAVWTKYAPKSKWAEEKSPQFEAQKRWCLCVESLLQFFLLIWFIAGCVWVYSIYEPVYDIKEHDEYCNKVVYLFTFWIFNISFIILVSIMAIAICCIFFAVAAPKKEDSS